MSVFFDPFWALLQVCGTQNDKIGAKWNTILSINKKNHEEL